MSLSNRQKRVADMITETRNEAIRKCKEDEIKFLENISKDYPLSEWSEEEIGIMIKERIEKLKKEMMGND